MAPYAFETNLELGQDGNTDVQSVDPFRNILKSISGGAIDVQPLALNSAAVARVKANDVPLVVTSPTGTLGGTVGDHLNFTHEFGLEVAEYLGWWYEAKLFGTLGDAALNAAQREIIIVYLANDMKAKYNAHIASAVHHPVPDVVNPVAAADAVDLTSAITLLNELKADFNLHRTQATVHAVNDAVNVVTAVDAIGITTAAALGEDIVAQYYGHSLNQLALGFHTIPDTINEFVKGGSALFQALLDAVPENYIQFPLVIRAAESGGWFKEALTLKKMRDGKYSNGDQMAFRAFGTHATALNLAFPAIQTPGVTAGVSELSQWFSGKYNGGENNEPWGDASPSNPAAGFFPNWPNLDGSVIAALGGRAHYYVGSYHTPFRHRCLLVNKTWFNTTLVTEQERDWVRAAARFCAMRNLTHSQMGGDAIINRWQDADSDFPVIVHRALPRDILDRMRTALSDAQETLASTDAQYGIMLANQRTFMKENAVRWGSLPDRTYRVARTDYETDLKVDRP